MKRFYLYFIILFAALAGASCGIETIQPLIKLNPPLGVETVCSNNKIYITFWGLNNETYFTGYDVYVALDTEQYNNDKGFYYTNAEGIQGNPTIWEGIIPVSSATKYTYVVDKYYDLEDFQNGLDYFFYVKAYSAGYVIHSDRSDYSKVTFVRN